MSLHFTSIDQITGQIKTQFKIYSNYVIQKIGLTVSMHNIDPDFKLQVLITFIFN